MRAKLPQKPHKTARMVRMPRFVCPLFLLALLCLFLSACGAAGGKKDGPYGFYANKNVYAGVAFEGEHLTYWHQSDVTEGTWTLDGDEILCIFDNGQSLPLLYDKEKDTLGMSDNAMFSKVSEKEYKDLLKEWESQNDTAASTPVSKTTFAERPDIETPDSRDVTVTYEMKEDEYYIYTLADNTNDTFLSAISYLSYLKTLGYEYEDISDVIDQDGTIVYELKKGSSTDGFLLYSYLPGHGFVMAVRWS